MYIVLKNHSKHFLGARIGATAQFPYGNSLIKRDDLLFQGRGRSSCGSSCWSCCRTRRTPTASRGRARTASSSWRTQTRWRGAGASANPSPTWTTTSSAGRLGNIYLILYVFLLSPNFKIHDLFRERPNIRRKTNHLPRPMTKKTQD